MFSIIFIMVPSALFQTVGKANKGIRLTISILWAGTNKSCAFRSTLSGFLSSFLISEYLEVKNVCKNYNYKILNFSRLSMLDKKKHIPGTIPYRPSVTIRSSSRSKERNQNPVKPFPVSLKMLIQI
jgi:hypothetical protein